MCVVGSGSRRWSRGSSRIRIRAMPPPSESHYLLTGVNMSRECANSSAAPSCSRATLRDTCSRWRLAMSMSAGSSCCWRRPATRPARGTATVRRRRCGRRWRGGPLADVPSELLHRDAVARLAEQRSDALHRRIEADLALGRHAELVAELRALTDRHPLREQFWAQLMTALYRCGRQADALQAYQRVSRLLADELGVDPGPELRALHQAILASDPALAAPLPPARPHAWARPSQLPLEVADFVGRVGLVDQIKQLLADDLRVPIVALSGSPGVGKTALAVHAAHRLAERFPDGQLYVNLHGATAGLQPLQPLEVLGRFLRALGTDPAAIPTDLEEASAAFRSRVAGRRLLVVLDAATDAAQIAPLLPASPGCGVLVTSR